MKKYKPIAVYSSAEDIIDLFPCDAIKPDMGDIIYKQYMAGHGTPRRIDCANEPESWWTEKEVNADKNFVLTSDKLHGVRFTRGVKQHGLPMGYFIDIYGLVGEDEPAPKGVTLYEVRSLATRKDVGCEAMDAETLGIRLPELIEKNGSVIVLQHE